MRVHNLLRLKEYSDFLTDHNQILEEQVSERTAQLKEAYRDTMFTLVRAAERKDAESGQHVRRISHYCRALTAAMDVPIELQDTICDASPMHDIGKIGLSDRVLNTKFIELPLADAKVYRTHTTMGEKTLNTLDDMQSVAAIIRSHHEYFNGTGFPDSLTGKAISIGARIVAIVEAYEELQSGDYAKAESTPADAVRVILSNKGTLFCPEMTDVFVRLYAANNLCSPSAIPSF